MEKSEREQVIEWLLIDGNYRETFQEEVERKLRNATREAVMYCQDCIAVGCNKSNHMTYHVDSKIIPILQTLHRKGYKTRFCCSGHSDRGLGEQYKAQVEFTKPYGFKPPKGFHINRNGTNVVVTVSKEVRYKKMLQEVAEKIVQKNIDILTEWANGLPDVSHDA